MVRKISAIHGVFVNGFCRHEGAVFVSIPDLLEEISRNAWMQSNYLLDAAGLSLGLNLAKIKVKVAVDSEADCKATYEHNQLGAKYLLRRLQDVTRGDLLKFIKHPDRLVVASGPPCQLFSRLNRSPADITDELRSYIRLVPPIRTLVVVFENVPAIKRRSVAWGFVQESLSKLGYEIQWRIVNCNDFGVPQKRERMIVLASRIPLELPFGNKNGVTVRDAIGHLPDKDETIPKHKGMNLRSLNLERIRKLKAGENSRAKNVSFADSYARMSWDKPSPTITTKCISFSNGTFWHPKYNRAITVREAATLQGFPEWYEFLGSLPSCVKQVRNAVPPILAEALGKSILRGFNKSQRNRKTG